MIIELVLIFGIGVVVGWLTTYLIFRYMMRDVYK